MAMVNNMNEANGGTAAPPPVLGLRERGKLRRRKRIKEAARAVFIEVGYEAATTREIAERAEVSPGTLFAYAPTKSELLLMIVNDDHDEMDGDVLPPHSEDTPLMDLMMDFGRRELGYWGKHPEMARQARRELAFVLQGRSAGPEALRFAARKPRLLAEMSEVVRHKQKAGLIGTGAPPELVAELWWAVYNQHLHNWLNNAEPDLRRGMNELRRLLVLAVEGLAADPSELGKVTSFLDKGEAAAKAPAAAAAAGRAKAPRAAKLAGR